MYKCGSVFGAFKGRNFLFLLSAFFFFLSHPASAQQPVFKNYGVKDGLPSSEVYHVLQDSKGYMWFCTDAGISRYDGYSFHNFSTREGLKDNTVFGSFEDRKGKIWFRTMSGKLYYFERDSIHGIEANQRIAENLQSGLVSSLYVDSADSVWCGEIVDKGFLKIAPPYKSSDVTFFTPLVQAPCAFIVEIEKSGFIWGTLHESGDRNTAYEPQGGILVKFSKQGIRLGNFESISLAPSPAILKLRSGNYIVTGTKGISTIGKPEKYFLPGVRFNCLYEDRSSDLWVGTGKDGVYCFEKGDLKSRRPRHYLKGLSVSSITEDSEGGFWLTTLENGVFYMASSGFLYYNKENGLSDNKILTIIKKDSASIMAGMANGDICLLSKDTLVLSKGKKIWPGENPIYRFFGGFSDGKIIAGAYCSFWFSPEKDYMREYLSEGKLINAYKCFTRDASGDIWGGNHLLLSKLDVTNKQVLESYPSKSRILSLCCDANNTIWAGCVNGLWSFKNGKFKYYGADNPFFENRIDDIKLSADSTWWFATKGSGLIVKRKNKFLKIDQSNGLSSNICRSIFIDQDGTVWVGTNNGIDRIIMKTWGSPVVEVYSSDDGLLSNEINEVIKTGNQIWAATNMGVVEFDAKTAFSNKTAPPIYITSIEINSVQKALQDSFHLKYFENYLKINFTGISYKRNSKMKYQFMLEGIDSKWNYTTNNNIQYTTLPPGAYTFLVYAMNNDGVKSRKPGTFYFVIAKPFWKEWWFIGMLMITIIGAVIGGMTYRFGVLRKRASDKSEVNRKMADLKLMALRAQMNPHFIFNAINSIQLFILKNDSESAHKHLSRFSRLIRNVLENSKHEYISLGVEIETLEHYIELERLRFSSKFSYKITVDEKIDVNTILISPLLIQPYVENAIWHGLMHLKDRPGKLRIKLELQDALLKCIVDDNGIGRANSAGFRKGEGHKSTGLSLNKERVDIINTLHQSTGSVKFIDKKDENGQPCGTQVEIFIPMNINYSDYI